MTYTEKKKRNNRRYYYRAKSVRKGKKVSKKRVYLGVNLGRKKLVLKEREADIKLKSPYKARNLKAVNRLIPEIKKILIKNNIKKAGIFGSYATGTQRKNSDIDILIQPPRYMSLWGFVGVKIELEEKLGKKVDLLSYDGVHPLLKKYIFREEIHII